jgi:hypothetical protein
LVGPSKVWIGEPGIGFNRFLKVEHGAGENPDGLLTYGLVWQQNVSQPF